MRNISASCDCPERGRAIEPTIDAAVTMAAQRAGLPALERLTVRADQFPDLRHLDCTLTLLEGVVYHVRMQKQAWASVAVYPDRISAEAALGLLVEEGVPAYIGSNEHVPGLGTDFSVLVPADYLRRSRWVLQAVPLSEGELTYLATGEQIDT